MRIESITLKNFRNYTQANIRPCEGVTVLAGANAQGKTNVLEAIHLCCTGRSHRTPRDKEMIRSGQDECYVKVCGVRNDGNHEVEVAISQLGRRRVKVNGAQVSRSGEMLGHITGVLFSPEDLRMIKDGPAERRRFIDMELSQLRPRYYYSLQRYNRALKQRAALLKDISLGAQTEESLDPWDSVLAFTGSEIMHLRKWFIEKLQAFASEVHMDVSGGNERLELTYEPSARLLSMAEETRNAYLNDLISRRGSDIKRQVTSIGVHRDDMGVFINGDDARYFASQGQVRTCALSLKLSEIELMREDTGEAPVLMLDDVMSELDPERRRQLVKRLSGVQTIITCTDRDDLAGADIGRLFGVKNAVLTQEEE
ncbi:MAG: DNA replication/repair protein RecF [Clostridiales bacterium]|nr:DNA replication/repair protein RecF [Clostridiales bacterium]